ncbi:MAG: putative acyl-CoA carboxylase, Biotin/lipoyl carrier domain [Rhizobacter sp.]|nr:putative acyl-CoA carboxylase, Biotin/lipoyl carrier domain [Rhizobacter sp.]
MTTFQFSSAPSATHRVQAGNGMTQVDGQPLAVREAGHGCFVADVDGRNERLFAVAHGDAVYVQLGGRAHRIERVDPTRSTAGVAAGTAGASHAPMPGVVVSVHAEVAQPVRQGDALLVIESMKLQMTIHAAVDGVVTELPFGVGQTFQRSAVLARVHREEVAA